MAVQNAAMDRDSQTAASDPANPRVTVLLLAVTGVEALVLFGAGIGLLLQPAVVAAVWPWPLTPFNAAFLGAVYAAALVSAAALTAIGRWSPARVVVPMILIFTAVVLAVSVLYLERFEGGWPTALWFVLYLVIPANAAWHVLLYERLPPADPALPPAWLGNWLRTASAALGAYGVALLALPEAASQFWPWPVDEFHARLYSATFLAPAAGLFLLSRAAAWAELWATGLTLLALGLLAVLGLGLADIRTGRMDWTAAGSWGFMAIFAVIALTGVVLCGEARRRARPAGPIFSAGLHVPPRWLAVAFGVAFVAAGIAGFLPAFTHPMAGDAPPLRIDEAYGLLIGLYPVNAVHSAFHLTVGLLGIAAFVRPSWALAYVRGVAIALAVLTVMGLLPGPDLAFGLAPLFGHDVWLHGIEAFAAAYVGWAMPRAPLAGTGPPPAGL
jgi:hypothetical protein